MSVCVCLLRMYVNICICVCVPGEGVCVRARTTKRVFAFEKQVPACRVPRGRLDSEATRWQDHGERARLCDSVSLLHRSSHPESACRPLARSRAVCVNERRPEHRRAASLHQPRINTSAGPYFRPRNLNFRTLVDRARLIFDLSSILTAGHASCPRRQTMSAEDDSAGVPFCGWLDYVFCYLVASHCLGEYPIRRFFYPPPSPFSFERAKKRGRFLLSTQIRCGSIVRRRRRDFRRRCNARVQTFYNEPS